MELCMSYVRKFSHDGEPFVGMTQRYILVGFLSACFQNESNDIKKSLLESLRRLDVGFLN